MEHTVWRASLTLVLLLFLTGCGQTKPMFHVAMGNYRYEQGRYHEAVAQYIAALRYEYQEETIYYNLGAVYSALGEAYPALQMWDYSMESQNLGLRSRSFYNRGVIFQQLGQYDEAIASYREALLLNPQNFLAKANIEVSQISRQEMRDNQSSVANEKSIDDATGRVLDYLKRRKAIFIGVQKEERAWIDEKDR